MLHSQEFEELVLPWFREHTSQEIVELAQALRMPFAPVPSVPDLLEDDHLRARDFFPRIEHPEAGELLHAGSPFRMSETPPSIGPAPTLGADNEGILGELGYSVDDQAVLRGRKGT